jgi:phage-related protein
VAIESVVNAIKTIINVTLAVIKGIWDTHGEAIMAVARNTWETILAIVDTMIKNIGDVIDAVAALIKGDWETFGDEMGAIWERSWETIKTVLSNAWDSIKTIIGSLIDSIKGAFKNVNWAGIGRSIINGIKRGVKGGVGALKGAVKAAAQAALNAAKRLLGIRSPSKAFAWVADMGIEGFVRQWEGRTPEIRDTVAGAITAAVQGASMTVDRSKTMHVNLTGNYRPQDEVTVAEDIRAVAMQYGMA